MTSSLRALPSVDRLLREQRVAALVVGYPRELVVQAAREALDEARRQIKAGAPLPTNGALADAVATHLERSVQPTLRRAINATGVVVHTNLGRAPLSEAALAAMRDVGGGYSNLEFDLDAGGRGSRHEHVSELLCRLSGAEAAVVVNNNAAALLLVLSAWAAGREVVISRGELVEIGGGFRIPDVLRQSGATLVEVGTTNRTYLADYEAAVSDQTAMFLRVHTSNFRVIGFVHSPGLVDLAAAAARHRALLVDDLGSGSFLDTANYGLAREPMVPESVAAGADLVCFSGDKLLGGPQAGIVVGRADAVAPLKRHPLMRALRPDKATLAGLGATLVHYLRREAETQVPVWRMISLQPGEIEVRARRVVDRLGALGAGLSIVDGVSAVGGGSLPGETLPTRLLALDARHGPLDLAAALRASDPPIVGRIEHDRVMLDLRTVLPGEDDEVVRVLESVLAEARGDRVASSVTERPSEAAPTR